jgi:hypothetical protein
VLINGFYVTIYLFLIFQVLSENFIDVVVIYGTLTWQINMGSNLQLTVTHITNSVTVVRRLRWMWMAMMTGMAVMVMVTGIMVDATLLLNKAMIRLYYFDIVL